MASLTFIIWQVRFAIWSQNHVPLGKVTSSLIPTALFIYWESMFSPYFSIHSDLFILKWNTLTMEQGRLHFPKYEIKFLSSESDANHWHSKSVLNQWTLALLASFQDLPQGPEEGSFSLLGFPSPPSCREPLVLRKDWFLQGWGQAVVVPEMCLCITHHVGTSVH